jgi:hypothetical protein
MTADPIRLGLIGAGVFVRGDHVPALEALHDVAVIEAMRQSGTTHQHIEVANLSDLEK